ncbi:carbon monoxide dehydrogenase subunit G [Virgibacillus natechei]|uniref:Carbon monoxide dehydrogenase subunit G n=1 Tax=Virgibacillus natechei TaxID=1216297 RepID=A0ABS4ILJ4_9BACI|nr:SRPBCC family protein [Virgibacillus natechei]MBP1971291.1 carbon monoxide dehydrogenase subunit G [Virgibacillus natechei]UZD12084.1 SRPBCC family protein [Virgibacillus natechei]
MPSGIHQVEMNIPIENVWSFVSDMNNWAPLVPGYAEHEILSDRQSTWKFRGDVGVIHKTVDLKIDITKWLEPTTVCFDLVGLNENFKGDGYFKAKVINGRQTEMTGYIDITAKGVMGPMINSVLRTLVAKKAKQLTEAVANQAAKMETVAT